MEKKFRHRMRYRNKTRRNESKKARKHGKTPPQDARVVKVADFSAGARIYVRKSSARNKEAKESGGNDLRSRKRLGRRAPGEREDVLLKGRKASCRGLLCASCYKLLNGCFAKYTKLREKRKKTLLRKRFRGRFCLRERFR